MEPFRLIGMHKILCLPTKQLQIDQVKKSVFEVFDESGSNGMKSILQRNPYQTHLQVREKIFSIANFCANCQISDFAQDQSDIEQFFTNITPQLLAVAKDVLIETKSTMLIKNVPWVID